MSVEVQHLTKVYGMQKAVNDLSFKANKGEILGFLGPNGAGKSTTMKIITCFTPATSGMATVCGFDTATQSMDVRRSIGYLPESNPLYKDMYVREYLEFVAGLHRLANPKNRVAEMVELTGLTQEQHKLITSLSKGYKQRVGLAQAMLHDPEVLILDEPTSGLDPNQLVEIRALIKKIGKEKTVIFSTHIMQEVQALCDRVIIINKGNLVADDSIDHLQDKVAGATTVTVGFLQPTTAAALGKIKGVQRVKPLEGNRWELQSKGKEDIRPLVFEFAVQQQLTLIEMQKQTSSLENIFQQLTQSK